MVQQTTKLSTLVLRFLVIEWANIKISNRTESPFSEGLSLGIEEAETPLEVHLWSHPQLLGAKPEQVDGPSGDLRDDSAVRKEHHRRHGHDCQRHGLAGEGVRTVP